jgi:hypothetical protein
MKDTTRTTLCCLAAVQDEDPAGTDELMTYGHLPEHLADALDDLEREGEGGSQPLCHCTSQCSWPTHECSQSRSAPNGGHGFTLL